MTHPEIDPLINSLIDTASSAPFWEPLYRISAPFRGYGMERVPGLRTLYRSAYRAFTRQGLRELKLADCSLLVDLADMSIVPSLRFTGSYEATFSRVLDAVLKPGATVVDVGAHVGYHAIRLANLVGPHGRVIAYEPEPTLADILQINIDRNGLSDRATAHRTAVGRINGRQPLWRNGSNTGGASLSREAVDGGVSGSSSVEVVTLDFHLLEDLELESTIDLIKVDVQGHEFSVLEGASKVIERDWPTIGFEYNPDQLVAAGIVNPVAELEYIVESDYVLLVADEYRHVVRTMGASAIHNWCLAEKPDGTSGFLNVLALHQSRVPVSR